MRIGLRVGHGQDPPRRHVDRSTQIRVAVEKLVEEQVNGLAVAVSALGHAADGTGQAREYGSF